MFRILSCLDSNADRFWPPVCCKHVVRKVHRCGRGLIRHYVRGVPVQEFTPRRDHVVVDRFPGQRVTEAVAPIRARDFLEQLLLNGAE